MTEETGGRTATFLFDTTTHVLWAEEVAGEKGIPVEVVPAPPAVKNKCGLALRTLARFVPPLTEALAEEGIPHQEYSGA